MGKSLAFRCGRYALASLLLAGGVIAGAACQPTKPPPNGSGAAAVLQIDPTSYTFPADNSTKTLTVTNTGPEQNEVLDTSMDVVGSRVS